MAETRASTNPLDLGAVLTGMAEGIYDGEAQSVGGLAIPRVAAVEIDGGPEDDPPQGGCRRTRGTPLSRTAACCLRGSEVRQSRAVVLPWKTSSASRLVLVEQPCVLVVMLCCQA